MIKGHAGQVTCVTMDPRNKFFVTGSKDRTLKFWNLVEGTLKITLTGHIGAIKGVVMSDRHPYLFSCADDKTVVCWDLETNTSIRKYHGHLSGVFCIAKHPTMDLIVSGGRDAAA